MEAVISPRRGTARLEERGLCDTAMDLAGERRLFHVSPIHREIRLCHILKCHLFGSSWRLEGLTPHCAGLARRRAECFLTLRRDSSHYVSRRGASPASDHQGWHNGYTSLRQNSSARSSQHIQELYSVSPPSPQSPHFGCSATYSASSFASAQASVLAVGRS